MEASQSVLASLLFTVYTSDVIHNATNFHLQKFLDDTAIVGLINNRDEREYCDVDWCQENILHIIGGKTKELGVNFQRCKEPK